MFDLFSLPLNILSLEHLLALKVLCKSLLNEWMMMIILKTTVANIYWYSCCVPLINVIVSHICINSFSAHKHLEGFFVLIDMIFKGICTEVHELKLWTSIWGEIGIVGGNSWSHKELDMTEGLNWTELGLWEMGSQWQACNSLGSLNDSSWHKLNSKTSTLTPIILTPRWGERLLKTVCAPSKLLTSFGQLLLFNAGDVGLRNLCEGLPWWPSG